MRVFCDTSGLYALLDADDAHHAEAAAAWRRLLAAPARLLTSNYVLVETSALVQARLGLEATAALHGRLVPEIDVRWITPEDHAAAVAALLVAGQRRLSLVDCSSFVLCRRLGIDVTFAWDRHFREQGLRLPE